MVVPSEHITNTLEIKQSKFIAHLVPYAEYDRLLERLRSEHPKARHFVTAFRHLNEFDQVVEGSSDDGEPRGTSGKPTLAVLQGNDLINAAVITVRYFGGTKLGTGGLVRAYSDAANEVIGLASLHPYVNEARAGIRCEYSDMGKVEYAIEHAGLKVIDKVFEPLSVEITLSGATEDIQRFKTESERLVTWL
jgi:uncharacterized YigZ family protein